MARQTASGGGWEGKEEQRMDYYADPKSMDGKPKGRIAAADMIQVGEAAGDKAPTTQFCVDCTRRRYELVAPSENDKKDWITKISAILNPVSATPARGVNSERPTKAKSIATSEPSSASVQQPQGRLASVPNGTRPTTQKTNHDVPRRQNPNGVTRAVSTGNEPRPPAAPPQQASRQHVRTTYHGQSAVQQRPVQQRPVSQGAQRGASAHGHAANNRMGQQHSQRGSSGLPWLFGEISREKSEDLLAPFKSTYNGIFLVRKSARFKGTFVVSLTWDSTVKHFLASKGPNGAFEINKRRTGCTTLANLVSDLKKSQSKWRMPLSVHINAATEKPGEPIPATARIDFQKTLRKSSSSSSQGGHANQQRPASQSSLSSQSSHTPSRSQSNGSRESYDLTSNTATPAEAATPTAAEPAMEEDEEEPIGVFEAVEPYYAASGSEDKMNLELEDVVLVYKIECGWAMAMKVSTGEEGWVPEDFLEPLPEGSVKASEKPAALPVEETPDRARPRTATQAGATLAVLEGSTMLASPTLAPLSEDAEEPVEKVPDVQEEMLDGFGDDTADSLPPVPPNSSPKRRTGSITLNDPVQGESETDIPPPRPPPMARNVDSGEPANPPPRPPKRASSDDGSVGDAPPRPAVDAEVPPPRPVKVITGLAESSMDETPPPIPSKVFSRPTNGESDTDGPLPPRPDKPAPIGTDAPPPRPAKDAAPPPRPPKDDVVAPSPSNAHVPKDAFVAEGEYEEFDRQDEPTEESNYADIGDVNAPRGADTAPKVPQGYVMMDPAVMAANRKIVLDQEYEVADDARNPPNAGPANPPYDAYSSDEEDDLPLPPVVGRGSKVVFETDNYGSTPTPSAIVEGDAGADSKKGGLFNRRTKRRDRKPPKTPPSQRATRHDGVPVREMSGADRIKLMLMVKDKTITQEQAVQHVEDYELGRVDTPFPVVEQPTSPQPYPAPSSADTADVDQLLDELDASADQAIQSVIDNNRASRHG